MNVVVALLVPVAASVAETVTVVVPLAASVEIPAPAELVLPQPDIAKPVTASIATTIKPRSLRERRPASPTASSPAIASPAGISRSGRGAVVADAFFVAPCFNSASEPLGQFAPLV